MINPSCYHFSHDKDRKAGPNSSLKDGDGQAVGEGARLMGERGDGGQRSGNTYVGDEKLAQFARYDGLTYTRPSLDAPNTYGSDARQWFCLATLAGTSEEGSPRRLELA